MEKVSSKVEHGIESKYFDINYRPSENHSNFGLNIACSSILTYMALADIARDNERINLLTEKFHVALSKCKTEEELNNFNKFMIETTKIGGYAVEFYASVSPLINVDGKEKVTQVLEDKKNEGEKPVSKRVEQGIESKYFDISYRPSENNSNFGLNIACSSILTYMALADCLRDEERKNNLTEKFYDALSKCKTEEELNNFRNFMREISKIGGYASIFYQDVITMINPSGKEDAINKLNEINTRKKQPVSKRIEHGIESKYFDIKYRPNGGLSELDINCGSLLTYIALADISRDEVRKNALDKKFMEVLSLCKTEEELKNFTRFMRETAYVGGYAIEYNDMMSQYINENGRNHAVKYLVEQEKKSQQASLEEWKEKFEKACISLEEIQSQPVENSEEISYLIRVFNDLQGDLYNFTGIVEKEFISQMDVQLDEHINYLRGMYGKLEEISSIKPSI